MLTTLISRYWIVVRLLLAIHVLSAVTIYTHPTNVCNDQNARVIAKHSHKTDKNIARALAELLRISIISSRKKSYLCLKSGILKRKF